MTDTTENIKNIYNPYDDDDKGTGDEDNIRYIFSEALHSITTEGILEKEKLLNKDITVANKGLCFFEGDEIQSDSDAQDPLTLQQKNTLNELNKYYDMFVGSDNKLNDSGTLYEFNKTFYINNDNDNTEIQKNNPKHLSELFGKTYRELDDDYILVGNKKIKNEENSSQAENYLFSEGMSIKFNKSPLFGKKNEWNSTENKYKFNFAISFKHKMTSKFTAINIVIENNDEYKYSSTLRNLRRLSAGAGASWEENNDNLQKPLIEEDSKEIAHEFNKDIVEPTLTYDNFVFKQEDINATEYDEFKKEYNSFYNDRLIDDRTMFSDPSNITLRVETVTDDNALILSYGPNHPKFIKIDNIPDDKFNERDDDDSFIFTGQIPTIAQLYRYAENKTDQLTYKDTKVRFKITDIKGNGEGHYVEMNNNGCFGTKKIEGGSIGGDFELIEGMTLNLHEIIKRDGEAQKSDAEHPPKDSFIVFSIGESSSRKALNAAPKALNDLTDKSRKYLTGEEKRGRMKMRPIIRPKIFSENAIKLIGENEKLDGIYRLEPTPKIENTVNGLLGLTMDIQKQKYYKISSISHLKQIMASIKEYDKNGNFKQKYREFFKTEAYFYKMLRYLNDGDHDTKTFLDQLYEKGKWDNSIFEAIVSKTNKIDATQIKEIYDNYIESLEYNITLFLTSLSTEIVDKTRHDKYYQMQLFKKVYSVSQSVWQKYIGRGDDITEDAYGLIDEMMMNKGLPPNSEYYIKTKQDSKEHIEYGIAFCGKVYSLKYQEPLDPPASEQNVFEDSEEEMSFSLQNSNDQTEFARIIKELLEGLETEDKQHANWYLKKIKSIYRNHLILDNIPTRVKLDFKSFKSVIDDCNKIWNYTLPNPSKLKFHKINTPGLLNVNGVTYDTNANQINGEFGYVTYKSSEKQSKEETIEITLNEHSMPKLKLTFKKWASEADINIFEKTLDKEKRGEKFQERLCEWLKNDKSFAGFKESYNTNTPIGTNSEEKTPGNTSEQTEGRWDEDREQLGFEANSVIDITNLFSNVFKSLKSAFKSKNAAHVHENEFVQMNRWYNSETSKLKSKIIPGNTRNITMNFDNKNLKCKDQEVSWDYDASKRSNDKIHYLFMLNQFIYHCLYELASKYIATNTTTDVATTDDANTDVNKLFDEKYKYSEEDPTYKKISDIWGFFDKKKSSDFTLIDTDLKISFEQLENLFSKGFAYSEIYPKSADVESTDFKEADVEIPGYSTNVTFNFNDKTIDKSKKIITDYYKKKFDTINTEIRPSLNEDSDSRYYAKLYTIYSRRYVAVYEEKDKIPLIYFEAWILEGMVDGKWHIKSIIGWGGKGLVLNVEQNSKIFLIYKHTPEPEDGTSPAEDGTSAIVDFGDKIFDELTQYTFTIEDNIVLTSNNKYQYFLSTLIDNISYDHEKHNIEIEIIKGGKCVPFKNNNEIISNFISGMTQKIKAWGSDGNSNEKIFKLILSIVVYMYFTLLHGNNYLDYDVLSIQQFLEVGKKLMQKIDLPAPEPENDGSDKLYNYIKVASGKDQYWEKMCKAEKDAIRDIVMGIQDVTDVQQLLRERLTYCGYLKLCDDLDKKTNNIQENFMDEVIIPHISKTRTWKHLDDSNDRKEEGQGGETTRAYKSQYRYYLYQDLINYMKYITIKKIMPNNHRFDCFFDKFCYLCNEIITDHNAESNSIFLNNFLIKQMGRKEVSESSASDTSSD